jgi:DNA adenine methylase
MSKLYRLADHLSDGDPVGDGSALADRGIEALLAQEPVSLRERALQTIIKNRVNRGGILAAGAGRLKHGEKGRGISSRWYPDTLRKRIAHIAALRDRFTFIHGDGLAVLRENALRPGVAFFIDPPYTAGGKRAGARLYTYADVDHEAVFYTASTLSGDFLMTYDNTEEVWELARRHRLAAEPVAMKSTPCSRPSY